MISARFARAAAPLLFGLAVDMFGGGALWILAAAGMAGLFALALLKPCPARHRHRKVQDRIASTRSESLAVTSVASTGQPLPVDSICASPSASTLSPTMSPSLAMPSGFVWMKSPVSSTTPLAKLDAC